MSYTWRQWLILTCLVGDNHSTLKVPAEAALGQRCTGKNSAHSCTQPQETCLPSMVCGCSPGFVPDISKPHTRLCQLPGYNHSCNATTGCLPSFECLNASGSWLCQCDQAVDYYSSTSNQCLDKPLYGEACDVNIGCVVFNECTGSPPTCQCNSSTTYFDSEMYQCMLMSDLKVTVQAVVISTTTITLIWDEQNPDLGLSYTMNWVPAGGHLDYLRANGGQLSGLQPATVYTINVISVLPADAYYPEKTVSVTLTPLRTMALDDSTDKNVHLVLGLSLAGSIFVVLILLAAAVVYMKRRRRSRSRRRVLDNDLSEHLKTEANQQKGQRSRQGTLTHLLTEADDLRLTEGATYGSLSVSWTGDEDMDKQPPEHDRFDTRHKTQLLVQ